MLKLLFGLTIAFSINSFAAKEGPVQMSSKTTLNQIRALPDAAEVRTPGGRVVTAGRYKMLADAMLRIKKAGKAPQARAEFMLSKTQGAAKVQLKEGVDLASLAKRPDSDVLQMPDGNKITVGDLKKLSVLQQRLGGQPLTSIKAAARPSLTGSAIKITSPADIKKLQGKPDSTVLENSTGRRITLGELRNYSKTRGLPLGVAK